MHGKSISERQTESAVKYRNKSFERYKTKERVKPVQYKPIRQQTRKESGIKSALSQLKTSIELEAVQANEYYCKGCGTSHPGLDKSHILSVGQHKRLELIKENIQLLCRNCHIEWESNDVERMIKLDCFESNLEFIKNNDQIAYNKLCTKIDELYNNYFRT